nr:hypothetical protein [Tanacetum cinerariifolium]
CLVAGGNTFQELWDNIQGYVAAAAVNYNHSDFSYRPLGVANQIRPPDQSYQAPTQQNQVVPLSELEKVKRMNEANMKAMQTQINNVKNELRNEMKNLIQASMSNQTNELKNMMASFFQMNTAYNSGSGSLPSNTIANSKGELKAITTRSGIVLDGPFIPIPPPFINPKEDERAEETLTDQDLAEDPFHPNIPYPLRMYKQKQQEKDEVQIHKFWQMFKQLHINITLADALILIAKYQKMLKALISNKEKLLQLANTPLNENCLAIILKKLPEKLRDPEKFLIPCGFSKLKCKALADLGASINLMPVSIWKKLESINMINIYDDSSENFLEELFTTNHQSGNPTFSSHPELTSPKVKDDIFDPEGANVLPKKLLDLDSTKYLHTPHHINPLSGNDDLTFDIESDLKEIEYLLHHDPSKGMNSILEDPIDQSNLDHLNDNLADTMPEMFTDEHALDYSSPLLYDEYDDDPFEVDGFLISFDYDSFVSEDFSKVDALPSTNNEDKVFNPGILIQETLFEVITRIAPDKNAKKLDISHASLILEDFDPPLYELPFFKEVHRYKALMIKLVNDDTKLSKLEINKGFINGLPKKWLSFCQSLRNTDHVKESELAFLFGKLKYEENLIDSIYETEKKKFLATANPLSTAFFSTSIDQDFQDSPDDDEEDIGRSEEYLKDLKEEYQERAILPSLKDSLKRVLKGSVVLKQPMTLYVIRFDNSPSSLFIHKTSTI